MNASYKFLIALMLPAVLTGCSKYLDLKPDKHMIIPTTLEDCEVLLNDYSTLNTRYPTFGEISADDYYVTDINLKSISDVDEKNAYLWLEQPISQPFQWQNSYKVVYQANQILSVVNDIAKTAKNESQYNNIIGTACFYRGFAFSQLISVFALPYNKSTATQTPGIPLRLSADMDYVSIRANLEESYNQVISDFKTAVKLLSINKVDKIRPAKAAAYAALARVYLDMQNYENAYLYADSTLQIKSDLINFNSLNTALSLPIQRFNEEVLFPATTPISSPMSISFAKIDTFLYKSYEQHDLRKKVFFKENTGVNAKTYAFKGSYDNTNSTSFVGLSTSEIHLIRAEAAARTGRISIAQDDIEQLLLHRYVPGESPEITESDPQLLLTFILNERRKELVFRGRRWADLKRLNADARFAKTILRYMDGKEYRLDPNSLKYAVLIPQTVIDESAIEQNLR